MKTKKPDGASATAAGGKLETQETSETEKEVLVKIGGFCDQVITGEQDIESTFFSTKGEASKLKAACETGDVGEVLAQLKSFHGEPNPAPFIARLESAKDDSEKPAVPHAAGEVKTTGSSGVDHVPMESIEIDQEAAGMFDRDLGLYGDIKGSICREGFHEYEPAKVWDLGNGKYRPYDGHTRIAAAAELGKDEIPVVKRSFSSRGEFLMAAIDEQVGRRNMSMKDRFAVVRYCYPLEAEKARKRHGGQCADKSADSANGRADAVVGRKIGYGPDTVSRIRALLESDDKELLEAVFKGEVSISGAYEILHPRKASTERASAAVSSQAQTGKGQDAASKPEDDPHGVPPVAGRDNNEFDAPDANSGNDQDTSNAGEKDSEPILVPAKFLQCVAACIDMKHAKPLLDVLRGQYSDAGRLFNDALTGRKAA